MLGSVHSTYGAENENVVRLPRLDECMDGWMGLLGSLLLLLLLLLLMNTRGVSSTKSCHTILGDNHGPTNTQPML